MVEKFWGCVGLDALRLIAQGAGRVTILPSKREDIVELPGVSIFQATTSHILMRLGTYEGKKSELLEALSWICQAVRPKPRAMSEEAHQHSQTWLSPPQKYRVYGEQALLAPWFVSVPLEDLVADSSNPISSSKCWTSLVSSIVVAVKLVQGPWGRGLELPFAKMVELAAVENYHHLDGGTLLTGFFTALVPVARCEETNSIQWHFESVDKDSGSFLSPSNLESTQSNNWFKTADQGILQDSRCFVGWFENAHILLGTRELLAESLRSLAWSSGTTSKRETLHGEGFDIGGHMSWSLGPISFGVKCVKSWRHRSNIQQFNPLEEYAHAVRLSEKKVALVLDTASKTTLMVSLLSLELHLCHRYVQEFQPRGNHDGHLKVLIPFAESSSNGGMAAREAIENAGHICVLGGDDPVNLRQLFLRINTNILESAKTGELSPDGRTISAFEIMDMITQPGRVSPLKQLKLSVEALAWRSIIDAVDVVGICANLGQAIRPVSEGIPSSSPSSTPSPRAVIDCLYNHLPEGRWLLAAHLSCLDELSRRAGGRDIAMAMMQGKGPCKLSDKAFLTFKSQWRRCGPGLHSGVWGDEVLQWIENAKGKGGHQKAMSSNTYYGLVDSKAVPITGVVVFGGSRPKLSGWKLPRNPSKTLEM